VGLVFNKLKMKGLLAWMMWAGIHIAYLVGFRNRLAVMLNWAFTFLTRGRDVRLITGAYAPHLPPFSKNAEPPALPLPEAAPHPPAHDAGAPLH
jgi:NADH dehydrogenase